MSTMWALVKLHGFFSSVAGITQTGFGHSEECVHYLTVQSAPDPRTIICHNFHSDVQLTHTKWSAATTLTHSSFFCLLSLLSPFPLVDKLLSSQLITALLLDRALCRDVAVVLAERGNTSCFQWVPAHLHLNREYRSSVVSSLNSVATVRPGLLWAFCAPHQCFLQLLFASACLNSAVFTYRSVIWTKDPTCVAWG